jgi:hypothetical protein
MDMLAVVIKKLKAEELTESFCEKHVIGSRSAAACREEVNKCQLIYTGKNLNIV